MTPTSKQTVGQAVSLPRQSNSLSYDDTYIETDCRITLGLNGEILRKPILDLFKLAFLKLLTFFGDNAGS
jgi:hypothetical protein